jgi:catechol 2,3-dioxygenase-like lactoylglutathione lyase family enzyme
VSDAVPSPLGIYETVLYGSDVPALARFYAEVVGLRLVEGPDELMAVLRLPRGGVLLLFDPEAAGRPGRPVPSHGAHGAGHVAFSVAHGSLDAWIAHLEAHGVGIERDLAWDEQGSRSLYVRDPAGNSLELVDGGHELWPD